MATFTLMQGDAEQAFEEHPTEVARKALMAAAEVEIGRWPGLLREAAANLPDRPAIIRKEAE